MPPAAVHTATLPDVALRPGVGRETLHAGRMILGIAIALTCLGLVMLYSSSSVRGLVYGPGHLSRGHFLGQLQWVALALLTGWAAATVRLPWLARIARPLFVATIALLVLTLVAGTTINNSRRWLRFGGLSLQPSELLKLTILLYLAARLAAREREQAFGQTMPLAPLLAPVGIGALLVLVQPDLGTALFLVAEAVVLLALAGVRPTRVLPFVATVLPLVLFYAYTRFAHVRRRLAGPGEQVREGLLAIGSGGLVGKGLGTSTQKMGFVPEAHTDFIFAVVGEELGFVGAAAVVLAFMAMVWYGRRIAWNARLLGPHAYYLAAGAVFLITFQALINLAVVTAVVPTKGIPLPFISKGGSNLVILAAAVGLLVNVARKTASAAGDDPWR